MKLISYKNEDYQEKLNALYNRPGYPPEIEQNVAKIVEDVRKNGDIALIKYAEEFDHIKLNPTQFLVTEEEINEAERQLDQAAIDAINGALANVHCFASQRKPTNWQYEPRPGVILGERFNPLTRVGVYIPGGTAPLVSTVIHTAGIAKAAGVEEIVAVTPPGLNGKIHPAVLYAMKQAGICEIYRLGGVYGIAALAYGTNTVPPVEKIVGPGNAYVTAAKKLVYGQVAIDMVAGPSEIMVIADETARADFIAADLLSQAEHGSGLEHAVLATNSAKLADEVKNEIIRQKAKLSRSKPIEKVLSHGLFLIVVENLMEAAEIASLYAPEHLEIITKEPEEIAKNITAAGAIFLGEWTPEPVGDFYAGPSHVLPTGGSGRYFSGLSVESFFRRSSIVKYTKEALKKEVDHVAKIGQLEGLDAHSRSATIRFKD